MACRCGTRHGLGFKGFVPVQIACMHACICVRVCGCVRVRVCGCVCVFRVFCGICAEGCWSKSVGVCRWASLCYPSSNLSNPSILLNPAKPCALRLLSVEVVLVWDRTSIHSAYFALVGVLGKHYPQTCLWQLQNQKGVQVRLNPPLTVDPIHIYICKYV